MQKSKTRTLLFCLLGLLWGLGLTIAAVPLYRLFCQHFGIPAPAIVTGPGYEAPRTKQNATRNPDRLITIRYTANTAGGMPINFHPATYSQKVHLGEPVLTAYEARNIGPTPLDGVAVHMLFAMGGDSGIDIASYVNLQQCFCFAQEHYPVNENLQLPLSFSISPDLPPGVHTITFSYTLFKALPNDTRIKYTPANPRPTNSPTAL